MHTARYEAPEYAEEGERRREEKRCACESGQRPCNDGAADRANCCCRAITPRVRTRDDDVCNTHVNDIVHREAN